MRSLFIVFALTYASALFAENRCELFTNPESCLGRTPEALSGVQYGVSENTNWMLSRRIDPTDEENKNLELLYVAEHNTPLGLLIEITTYRNVIFHIRLSTSTSRYSPNQEEFEEFKESIRRTRPSESWSFKERGRNDYETYEDSDIKIGLFSNAVIMRARAIGPQW